MQILGQVYPTAPLVASGAAVPAMTTAAQLIVAGPGPGGAVIVEFAPPSSFDSIGAGVNVADGIITAAAGTLLEINGKNNSASVRFFQLFDTVAVPADATAPITIPIEVLPGSHFTLSFANGQGRSFATGITFASSSTELLKTVTLVPDMIILALFR